jgi:hypothetical protein
MWDIFLEIEQAGKRCKQAADHVAESALKVLPTVVNGELAPALKALGQPAKDAAQAFELARDMVPKIEAILESYPDRTIDSKLLFLRGSTENRPRYMQAQLLNDLMSQSRSGQDVLNSEAVASGIEFAEVSSGLVSAFISLGEIGDYLCAIADRLKVIHQHLKPKPEAPPAPSHHIGDIVTHKYTSNITGSNVGAVGIGDQTRVEGSVNVGAPVTQTEHVKRIKTAQHALLEDQETLKEMDARLYEALDQFLRMAREIQVEQKTMAELQTKMKETLDDVWAAQATKGLRPQMLPKTLEVVKALGENPVTAEVAKKLIGL